MTHTALPDPFAHAAFYEDTTTKRAAAWVIDVVLITTMSVLLTPLTLFTSIFYFPVFYMAVGIAYRTASIARLSGTPGMRVMSVELRDARGERFDVAQAFLHTLTRRLGKYPVNTAESSKNVKGIHILPCATAAAHPSW